MDDASSPVGRCLIGIHDHDFSVEHVLFNQPAVFATRFESGTLLAIRPSVPHAVSNGALYNTLSSQKREAAAARDPSRNVQSLIVVAGDVPTDVLSRNPGLQLSVSSNVARVFKFKRNDEVVITKADIEDSTATHVELSIKDVYLTRAEMRRIVVNSLYDRALYAGQRINYFGSATAIVKGIYHDGRNVKSAYFDKETKPIFRTESARVIIYIQMSSEMWNYHPDGSGNTSFDRVASGVLPELFSRWSAINARHLVSVVFFTRIKKSGRDSKDKGTNHDHHQQDFFRVVVAELSSGEWSEILRQVKTAFQCLLAEILTFRGSSDPSGKVPASELQLEQDTLDGFPTNAKHGNILEAINAASSAFAKDFVDTDLVRTGLSLIIITPSAGIFEVDEHMLQLTTENLVNNGINIDLLCLSQPPLHAAPLFCFQRTANSTSTLGQPETAEGTRNGEPFGSGKEKWSAYTGSEGFPTSPPSTTAITAHERPLPDTWVHTVPHWMYVHFWYDAYIHPTTKTVRNDARKGSFDNRTCQMSDVHMNGIMESEMSEITLPSMTDVASFEDTYDSGLFGPIHHDTKADVRASRPASLSSLNLHPNEVPRTRSMRSGISTLPNSPLAPNGVGHLIKQDRWGQESDRGGPSVASQATQRPVMNTRSISTSSSILSGSYARKLIFPTNRGLSLGKAAASTSTTVTRFDPAPSTTKDPTKGHEEKTNEVSSNHELSRPAYHHGKSPGESTASKTSSELTSRPPTAQTAPLDVPKAIERTPKLRIDEIKGSSGMTSNMPIPRSHEIANLDVVYNASNSPERRGKIAIPPPSLPFSLARWLIITNPLKGDPVKAVNHGWSHAFTHPQQALNLDVKWKSLCSPAALPLTSDHVVRRNMLPYYEERMHKISLDDAVEGEAGDENQRVIMLSQMIAYRLAKGFQIVKGSPEDDFSPFDNTQLGEEGRQIYFMKGNTVHVLLAAGDDIEVHMYQPKTSQTAPSEMAPIYKPWIKSTLEPNYERAQISMTVARDEHNWSTIDNYIAGHIESFTTTTGFWRARFCLIPVEPSRTLVRAEDTVDELRIDGVLRLTQIWQRSQVKDEDAPSSTRIPEKNPLGIEFQTRDLSAVLLAGAEESVLLQGQSIARSTQLFVENEDHYRSDSIDLRRLADDLQGPKGISVKDRRWYLKLHRRAFVGLDLTAWLLKNFQDVTTREEAEHLGTKLMEMGLFRHVRSAHTFRDGNYFYQFMSEYQITKKTIKSSLAQISSPAHSAHDSLPAGNAGGSPTLIDDRTKQPHGGSPASVPATSMRRKIYLTAKVACDIDIRHKSDRPEIVSLHYDRICSPEGCYHFRLEWMSTTEKLVEEAITSWATTAERYGWKLVQAPTAEACKIAEVNPFRTPTVVIFAIPPPEQEPDLSHVDSTAPEPLPTHRYHPYQRALLKRFGFVMDVEAAVNMPADVDLRYSYDHTDHHYSQYIHKSGTLMAQVDIDGRLLLVANRLANNRSSFARDAALRQERRDQDRAVSGSNPARPGTSNLEPSTLLGSPRPGTQQASPQLKRPPPSGPQSAEAVKEALQAFCANREGLLQFYEEVSQRDPLLSPKMTPAMEARHPPSSLTTPMMHATIPALELPPMSGIGQLLYGSALGTPLSGPSTPFREMRRDEAEHWKS